MCRDQGGAHRFGRGTDWLAAGRAEVGLDLSRPPRIAPSVGAQEALQLSLIERPGCAGVETLEVEALRDGSEAAEQCKLREHGAVAAREVRQEPCLPESLAADDAEHMAAPVRVRKHLPEARDGDRAVADRRAVWPLSIARFRIDIRP